MSFEACAEMVRKGDPDRFLSTMAAPAPLRARMFAIYAFNLEVARTVWVSKEEALNEIRLQWWHDALEEITNGGPVRRHEIVTPLSEVLDPSGARLLQGIVAARRRDITGDPFKTAFELEAYLQETAGTLMWVTARAIGAKDGEKAIRDVGSASGLANYLMAVPELIARGREPMPPGDDAMIYALSRAARFSLKRARKLVPAVARPATRSGWRAARALHSAAANPAVVANGGLHTSEFSRRASLMFQALIKAA